MTAGPAAKAMVRAHLAGRDITSRRVLGAFLRVDRAHFLPPAHAAGAYADHPSAIGCGQTISQPYMAALMLQALTVHRGMKVLEVGAGSGYVLALLTAMGTMSYGIEWHKALASAIADRFRRAGLAPPAVRQGDGGLGWPEEAPFDRILVSAACPSVPPPLVRQLAPGGILVAPVDRVGGAQVLVRLQKTTAGVREDFMGGCVFVPLLGTCGSHHT